MELLRIHRSVRKYLPKDIEHSVLNEILEDGMHASNTGNMQLYCVIVTKDEERKTLLSPLHFNQPMVIQAPVILTICLDINRFNKWCAQNSAETDFKNMLWLLNGTIDASVFAQNICISAENLGLGICYLGTTLYNASEISSILKLPVGVIPITALTIGYPEGIAPQADRLPAKAIVHYEEYSDFSDSDIAVMYGGKENLSDSLKFVAENGKKNLAQVYTEVRYKKYDNQLFSKKLLDVLVKQGYCFD